MSKRNLNLVCYLGAYLGFMTAVRVGLYWIYQDRYFSDLSLGQIGWALVHGVRFDGSVAATFFSLPFLLLLVPMPSRAEPAIQLIARVLLGILGFVMGFFLIADVVYFGYVGRHLADELILLSGDLDFLITEFTGSFALITLAAIAGLVGLMVGLDRLLARSSHYPRSLKISIFWIVGFAAMIRGSTGHKPLSPINGFISTSFSQGQLVLNGAFTAWHASRNTQKLRYDLVSEEEMAKALAALGIDSAAEKPFTKVVDVPAQGTGPNLVLILLESWFPPYMDGLGQNFGVTPNFQRLLPDGLYFDQFFANGTRSIEAIQTILTSFPALAGLPTLGLGFASLGTDSISRLASDNGYESTFIQSSARGSFHLDAAARAMGFDHYFGGEDIPQILDYQGEPKPPFGWDYETFQFAAERASLASKPFFMMVFTGSTHTPFPRTPFMHDETKHDRQGESGYLNALKYADASLGAFMDRARKSAWFEDTIFLITADHTFAKYRPFTYVEEHRIPLLIYGPKWIRPGRSDLIGSHVDLMATIAQLAGWTNREFSSAGSPLLIRRDGGRALGNDDINPKHPKLAYFSGRFSIPGILTPAGYLRHSLEKRVDSNVSSECDEQCLVSMENQLLSLSQFWFTGLRRAGRCGVLGHGSCASDKN